MAGKFEVYKDKAGEFRFRLKAGNGENILGSEGYKAKASCLKGIESVRKNSQDPKRFQHHLRTDPVSRNQDRVVARMLGSPAVARVAHGFSFVRGAAGPRPLYSAAFRPRHPRPQPEVQSNRILEPLAVLAKHSAGLPCGRCALPGPDPTIPTRGHSPRSGAASRILWRTSWPSNSCVERSA